MTSRVMLAVNISAFPGPFPVNILLVAILTIHNEANDANEISTIILDPFLLAIWSRKQLTLEYRSIVEKRHPMDI
jgi:hypothetical protein